MSKSKRQKVDDRTYREWRSKEILRERRDRRNARFLTTNMEYTRLVARLANVRLQPLTVYFPSTHSPASNTPFPIRSHQGRSLPAWERLSQWMKVRTCLLYCNEYGCITFTANLHPDLESAWVAEGRDIRATIRDRLRKNLAAVNGHQDTEVCFLIEGHSKGLKQRKHLHIHGFALERRFPGETFFDRKGALFTALLRTAGHAKPGRDLHACRYWRDGPTYPSYIFKRVPTKDERLAWRKLTMSSSMIAAGRRLWNIITGREDP